MKKKVFIMTLSKVFLKGHPRAGELTNFKEQYLEGVKIHTIRGGEYWEKVVPMVNSGAAVLSLRQWSGKPYASPMDPEFACLEKLDLQGIEVKDGVFRLKGGNAFYNNLDILAKNDGLGYSSFLHWFKYPKPFDGNIIHFTDFKY